ncbi:hypothetical protein CEUSTIGMA_g4596.t1, partial [Chlamydomonas eustigma]
MAGTTTMMRFMVAAFMMIHCFSPYIRLTSAQQPNFTYAIELPFMFLEIQQSGYLASWNRFLVDFPDGWRNDSHLDDGEGPSGIGADLRGGWYDAGDHLKITLTMSYMLTTLSLGSLVFNQGYKVAGQDSELLLHLRWGSDYLLKAHYDVSDEPSLNSLVAQVGDLYTDHNLYWGRPEQQPQEGVKGTVGWRPVWLASASAPGANVAGHAAAGLAAASVVLNDTDPAYASSLLSHAKQLFGLASTYPGNWKPPQGTNPYNSTYYQDEVVLAAAWLCIADNSTCGQVASLWTSAYALMGGEVNIDWDNSLPMASAVILNGQVKNSIPYSTGLVTNCTSHLASIMKTWQATSKTCSAKQTAPVCYTPSGGFAFLSGWGSSRYTANAANMALLLAELIPVGTAAGSAKNQQSWAYSQLSYILGSNPMSTSFLVGYVPSSASGIHFPTQPHHEGASCQPDFDVPCNFTNLYLSTPNPETLYGALVGGLENGTSDFSYHDIRSDSQGNEAAIDYVAALSSALASLVQLEAQLPSFCSIPMYMASQCGIGSSAPPPPSPPTPQPLNFPPRPPSPPPTPLPPQPPYRSISSNPSPLPIPSSFT